MKTKFAVYTLGCKLNFTETSYLAKLFDPEKFELVKFNAKADIYIINTCSVTASANSKSRNIIRKAINLNPDAIIAVTGCYAQLKPDEIADIQGVNIITGSNQKLVIRQLIEEIESKSKQIFKVDKLDAFKSFEPAFSYGDRTRSFLKVQDGCNYKCAYCTIPLARGNSRNQSIAQTINQIDELSKKQVKEVIISGINLGDFGKSTNESFKDLVQELAKTKMPRIRISSVEPNLLSPEIIEIVANSENLMPHFHIPLQSGSDQMLKIMIRRYNTDLFRSRIEFINKTIPDAFIGVDIITGVNGETDSIFQESYKFVESLNISELHVFSFSERENTDILAVKPKISVKEIENRSKLLHMLSDKKHKEFAQKNIGSIREVLWETTKKSDKIFGFTDNYLKCETKYDSKLVNNISKTEILEFGLSNSLVSRIIE
ncbi:MAG: tRNA (N(6)-L-threonylcarbamoyladenosine(37)-C(2))-methylthiotransferase MtaB [Bacteroidales bacterium]|nr:tRNA (N(6)-L-threonylcarbamoyladenosine(37)-C(2))-methylthiotransferase MtaB [Bacteroidales bacterium]